MDATATNMCFGEKAVYSQEVLALVLKYLMDQQPLPTLFMRTVLQALAMHPKLIGFVMNILQRLITKQVSHSQGSLMSGLMSKKLFKAAAGSWSKTCRDCGLVR
jgi:hypothetical protein